MTVTESSGRGVALDQFTVSAQEKLAADMLHRQFETGQSNAIERLVALKATLRHADDDTFWMKLMEELTSICNAQCGFVVEECCADSNNTMEETTSEGSNAENSISGRRSSHLMPVVYFRDGENVMLHLNYKPWLWDFPCHAMAKDRNKSFLVADNLSSLVGETNMSQLPFPTAAYLAVPLFDARTPVARLGLMWTSKGLEKRNVSWAYLEMILHSLEDVILQHMYTGRESTLDRVRESRRSPRRSRSVSSSRQSVPYKPEVGQPTLKLYARSMSHELRTPMHGVVGMLDVMHGTVEDSIHNVVGADENVVKIFERLRGDIEVIQDSARRAIEAADNIVHAYDLNMQIPDTPESSMLDDTQCASRHYANPFANGVRPHILIEGSGIPVQPQKKRPRSNDWSRSPSPSFPIKSPRRDHSRTAEVRSAVEESDKIVRSTPARDEIREAFIDAVAPSEHGELEEVTKNGGDERILAEVIRPIEVFPPMVLHYTKIRELLHLVINESLHVGGRPDSSITEPTPNGENIEIRSSSSNGDILIKHISWEVDTCVPDTLFLDEKDLAKLVSCVFLNALKFTESGSITLKTRLNHTPSYVIINITDTGTGIPEGFMPNLFKAFAREDGSTTRSKEGLGLGLLVAKGLSRKLGGDLICVRSSTCGEQRGTEFEIRLPIALNEVLSRPSTPGAPSASNITTEDRLICTDNGVVGTDETTLAYPKPLPEHLKNASTTVEPGVCTFTPSPPTTPIIQASSKPQSHTFDVIQSPIHRPRLPSSISAPILPTPMSTRAMMLPHNQTHPNGHQILAERHPLTFMIAEDNRINRKILVTMLERLGYFNVYQAFDGCDAVRLVNEVLEANSNQVNGRLSPSPETVPLPRPSTSQSLSSSSSPSPSMQPNHFSISSSRSSSPVPSTPPKFIDVILMDLWMPNMDGYEATEHIFSLISAYRAKMADSDPTSPLPPMPTVLAVSADVTGEALQRATKIGMKGYMTKPYKLRDLERLLVEYCASQVKWRI